jgi:hypothetical protein
VADRTGAAGVGEGFHGADDQFTWPLRWS